MLRAIFLLGAVVVNLSFASFDLPVSSAANGIDGDWSASFTIANQTVDGTISLDVKGETLTGSVFTVHTGNGKVTDGKFENGKLSCTLTFEKHESIRLTGELKDDKLSGSFATEGMTGTWTATRKK